MFFRHLRSQRGFSLVQTLIAVGLMSGVSYVMAQLITNLTNVQVRARLETELMDRMEDARKSLIRSHACLMTLNSSNQPLQTAEPIFPLVLDKVVDENNQILFQTGQPIDFPDTQNDRKMIVREITAKLNGATPDWLPSTLIVLDVVMKIDLVGVKFGVNSMVKDFSLTVETGAAKEIINCNSAALIERIGLEEAICNSFGAKITAGGICDLRGSASLVQATCESVGLKANDKGHCE